MINFGLYDQVADAEVELEQLVMKDNHKATKFFVDLYWISALLDYNNQALHLKAYLTLLERIKDKLIHFEKPQNLDDLWGLMQKIDQHYWECHSKLSQETSAIPNPNQKPNKISKPNLNSDQKENPTPSTFTTKSGSTDKDNDKSKSSGNQKTVKIMSKQESDLDR